MTRRSKKAVDYSQFGDGDGSDDEDFTSLVAPSHKKSKRETKKKKEPQNKLPVVEVQLQKRAPNKRVALDDKLYHRDLEVALALSVNEPALGTCEVKDSQEQVSVLHEGANRCDETVKDFQQRTASQQKVLSESQGSGTSACSYEPEAVSTEESKTNSSFSEDSDDEFLEKKATKENGKKGKMQSAKSEKAKTTSKLKKSSVVKAKPQATLKRDPRSSEPVGKPLKTSSPTAPKRPSWTPPAASGRSSNPLGGVLVKSPSQSLRLGLSRLARVKPLHPSVTSI